MGEFKWSIPETMSEEARRFFAEAKPLERWSLAGGNVENLRKLEHEETEPINEGILEIPEAEQLLDEIADFIREHWRIA